MGGKDLGEFAVAEELPPIDTYMISRKILSGLAYMHSRGIYHLDIKPENILAEYTKTGINVKLIDLGISRARISSRFYEFFDEIGRRGMAGYFSEADDKAG